MGAVFARPCAPGWATAPEVAERLERIQIDVTSNALKYPNEDAQQRAMRYDGLAFSV